MKTPSTPKKNPAAGADISWLTQLEDRGVRWVDALGNPTDPLSQLEKFGINSIRLRVMVDPGRTRYTTLDDQGRETGLLGYCDEHHIVETARAYALRGFRIMVDFHFSDTWADPANQFVPAGWQSGGIDRMEVCLARHVSSVLGALKTAGVTPEWVQLGNEIPNGILWGPEGASGRITDQTGWEALAFLLNAGYAAVKAVNPKILVVVHLDRGYDNALYRRWFDCFHEAGGRWDVVGMSFYPFWQPEGTVAQLRDNLRDMVDRYRSKVMVCEVGGPASDPVGTRALLAEVRAAVASVPDGAGLGVFYWEPEAATSDLILYALGAAKEVGPKQWSFTEALSGIST